MVERATTAEKHEGGERPTSEGHNRRRHARYRFSEPITLRIWPNSVKSGMTLEISASGTSIMTAAALNVGETVELESIAGGKLLAAVRHRTGSVFGFEFLNLTEEQTRKISEACKALPLYRNSLSI
jgi:hypothetical protein